MELTACASFKVLKMSMLSTRKIKGADYLRGLLESRFGSGRRGLGRTSAQLATMVLENRFDSR